MSTRALLAGVIGTLTAGLPPAAFATDGWHGHGQSWRERANWSNERKEDRLVDKYDRFAGSDDNAEALVDGLRDDKTVTLKKGSSSTSFNPPTNKMGYGSVDVSLALARASLAKHGIRNPTPEQIKAAMVGGTVTSSAGKRVAMPGVLKLRASGMGWGEIAHKHGLKPGDFKHHHPHKHADWKRHGRDDDDDDDRGHRKHAKHKHHHKHGDWKHYDRDDDDDDRGHRHKHAGNKHKHDHKHAHWKHRDREDHGDRKHHKHVKHEKHDWKHHHGKPDHKHAHWKHQGRPDFHRAKYERPERPNKIDRPEKHERVHRPERVERHGRR